MVLHRASDQYLVDTRRFHNVTWKDKVTDEVYLKGYSSVEPKFKSTALTPLQASLVPVASYTTTGEMGALKQAFSVALDAGVTINELKESILHLYAYLGFPRALNGLATLLQVVDERKAKGIKDEVGPAGKTQEGGKETEVFGRKVQTTLSGSPVSGPLFDFVPAANTYLQRHLFGDLFGRGVLDYASWSRLTPALVAMRMCALSWGSAPGRLARAETVSTN